MSDASKAIRKGLVELAKKSNPRTLVQEVREALPEIEKALEAGASYASVCETFNEHGVPISETVLHTYLYRLRKAATAATAHARPAPKKAAARRSKP